MRNLKKILALVLAMVMVLSMMVTANAAFVDADKIDTDYAEAVQVLSALGVINGIEKADGSYEFNPQGNLTRAQAATIVSYILTGDLDKVEALAEAVENPFTDLPSWATPYVLYAYNEGLVVGDGNGKYAPNRELTGYEFGKMLLVATGICESEDFAKDWKVVVARELKDATLWDSDMFALSKKLTREEACALAFNALCYGEVSEKNVTKYVILPTSADMAASAVVGYEFDSYAEALAEALAVEFEDESTAVYNADFVINTIVVTEEVVEDSLAEDVFGMDPVAALVYVSDIDPNTTAGHKWNGKLVATNGTYSWVVDNYDALGTYAYVYHTLGGTVITTIEATATIDVYGLTAAEWKAAFAASGYVDANCDFVLQANYYVNGEYVGKIDVDAPTGTSTYTAADKLVVSYTKVNGVYKLYVVSAISDVYTMEDVTVAKDLDGNYSAQIGSANYDAVEGVTGGVFYNNKINPVTGKVTADVDYSNIDWASYYDVNPALSGSYFYVQNVDGRLYFSEVETVTGTPAAIGPIVSGTGISWLDGAPAYMMVGTGVYGVSLYGAYNYTGLSIEPTIEWGKTYTLFLDPYGSYFAVYEHQATTTYSDIYQVVHVYDKVESTTYGTATKYYAQVIDMNGVESSILIGVDAENGTYATGKGVKTLSDGLYRFSSKAGDTVAAKLGIKEATPVIGIGSMTAANPVAQIDLKANTTFTSKLGKVTAADDVEVRLTANTKYLFWYGDEATLKTQVVTGGINFALTASNSDIIVSKDADGNYIAEIVVINAQYVNAGLEVGQLVYSTGNDAATYTVPYTQADGTVTSVYVRTVYNALTGEAMTVKSVDATLAGGFYQYKITDGIYDFEASPITDTDYIAVDEGAQFDSKYGTLIDSTGELNDAETAKTVFVDLRSAAAKAVIAEIDSVDDIIYWEKRGYDVTFDALYTIDPVTSAQTVVSIFVYSVVAR